MKKWIDLAALALSPKGINYREYQWAQQFLLCLAECRTLHGLVEDHFFTAKSLNKLRIVSGYFRPPLKVIDQWHERTKAFLQHFAHIGCDAFEVHEVIAMRNRVNAWQREITSVPYLSWLQRWQIKHCFRRLERHLSNHQSQI